MADCINFEIDFDFNEGYCWKIVYGNSYTNFFEVEDIKYNIFRTILNIWKRFQKELVLFGTFSASTKSRCDPIKLIDLNDDISLYYKNCENIKLICLCNNITTPFSSLNINFEIKDEELFLSNLESAVSKVDMMIDILSKK